MHEIGVRKTLGSSAGAVAGLLLIDFSKPVIIANLLAWPLAWVAAQIYLSPFSQRIEVGPLPFLASLAITLVIAWLAVGGQTLRAATVQPANVLRRA
jgi:putative ABC transport system permease protein